MAKGGHPWWGNPCGEGGRQLRASRFPLPRSFHPPYHFVIGLPLVLSHWGKNRWGRKKPLITTRIIKEIFTPFLEIRGFFSPGSIRNTKNGCDPWGELVGPISQGYGCGPFSLGAGGVVFLHLTSELNHRMGLKPP